MPIIIINVEYLANHSHYIGDSDCRWLYHQIYRPYVVLLKSKCTDIVIFMGNSMFHDYYAILQMAIFKRRDFEKFAQYSCRDRYLMSYSNFAHTVCRGNFPKGLMR